MARWLDAVDPSRSAEDGSMGGRKSLHQRQASRQRDSNQKVFPLSCYSRVGLVHLLEGLRSTDVLGRFKVIGTLLYSSKA